MLSEHYKNVGYIRSNIYVFTCRLDMVRAAYWCGVAEGLGIDVPSDVLTPIVEGSYKKLDLKTWIKAYDAWEK